MLRKTDRYGKLIDLGEDVRFDFTGPFPTQVPTFGCNAFAVRSVEEFEKARSEEGPIYGRVPGHPNHVVLRKKYGFVAGADDVMVRSDGMSVINQILWSLLRPNDHIIASLPLYSGTYEFMMDYLLKFGVVPSFFRASDTVKQTVEEILQKLASPTTKVVFIESCANPTLDLVDVKRVADFCRERNIILVVDDTLPSVFLQNSLNLGADIVIEAITKNESGGQMMGGAAAWRRNCLNEKLKFWRRDTIEELSKKMICLGGTMDYAAANAFSQNLKNAFIPAKKRSRNALKVARWLQEEGRVIVKYPGLPFHAQYELACRQMVDEDGNKNFGCMIYFDLGGDEKGAREFAQAVARTKKILLAVSLAAPETILTHVSTMIFGNLDSFERKKLGISQTAFRLSVGLQPVEEICGTLAYGFSAIK